MFTAVFDLDGTLADTAADLLAAANLVFIDAGHKAPLTLDDRKTALMGGRRMLHLGASRLGLDDIDAFVDNGYEPLLHNYRQSLALHTRLYDDVIDVLVGLKADGWALAVCTNKPIDLAQPLLELLNIDELFDAVIGARSLPVSKPDPAPLLRVLELAGGDVGKAVLVGDSATDYHTAQNAGSAILLVDFDDTHIAREFPDAPVVGDFRAVGAWLQNWRAHALKSAKSA